MQLTNYAVVSGPLVKRETIDHLSTYRDAKITVRDGAKTKAFALCASEQGAARGVTSSYYVICDSTVSATLAAPHR